MNVGFNIRNSLVPWEAVWAEGRWQRVEEGGGVEGAGGETRAQSVLSSLVEERREPVMGRGKHMAGKRFFRGGKCHVYGTGEKEGARGGWERQEERWARAASGASPPRSLAKFIRAGRSCGRQRDAGADVEGAGKI